MYKGGSWGGCGVPRVVCLLSIKKKKKFIEFGGALYM